MPAARIRDASPSDTEAMLALLPRLAAFDFPERRCAEHLWEGDEKLLRAWLEGRDETGIVKVAVENDEVLGLGFARLKPELLSAEPSAHLEVLAVDEKAQGRGVGRLLMAAIEKAVYARGARTLTLHVFAANSRARRLYDGLGYEGELVRYIKDLEAPERPRG